MSRMNLNWNSRPSRLCSSYLVVIIILLLVYSQAVLSEDWRYTVKSGDNLWTLTEAFLPDLSYVAKLQKHNAIKDPYVIQPGSIVHIPLDWLKSKLSSAQVITVTGNAYKSRGKTEQGSLQTGEQIGAEDKIITGEQSSAIIEFKDGSRLLIHDNTELTLKRVEKYPDSDMVETEIILEKGRVKTKVPEQSKGKSVFKITTPSATTAVRGTILRSSSFTDNSQSNTMQVEVLRGRVAVFNSKASQAVTAGHGIVVAEGNPPGQVVKLLNAPKLINPDSYIDRLSTLFHWQKLPDSNQYRVEVFDSNNKKSMVWNRIITGNRLNVPDLPDGDYTIRIRAIDRQGLEGRDTVHHYTLNARPEPPLPGSPQSSARIENNALVFRWSESDQATQYHIQIADDSSFKQLILDRYLSDAELQNPLQLKPGKYYWRLSSKSDTEEGPYSDTQTFDIIPPVPEALETQGDDQHLIFRWQKGEPGLNYQMQLSKNADFTQLLLDTTLSEPRLEVDRPSSDRLYLRMRPISTDQFTGNWSSVQFVDPPEDHPWYLLMLMPLLLLLLLL
ncbi:MAG: FecR domain-containing protein [Gammaproteobacteria bacterium]|nr:FecR domain-containing protein [Gammaproteobacteria bacterium]